MLRFRGFLSYSFTFLYTSCDECERSFNGRSHFCGEKGELMRNTATLFFTFAIILIGSAVGFGQNRPLADTEWKLVEANGIAVTNSSAAIKINEDSTRFTGSTGCNQMFGTLTVRGRNIDFQGIGTTKRM